MSALCTFIGDGRIELDTNTVEPFTYLKDVLERMSAGHPMNRIDELLPWNWRPDGVAN